MCRARIRCCDMAISSARDRSPLLVEGARRCVGQRFCWSGRGEGHDCLGVIRAAAAFAGIDLPVQHGLGPGTGIDRALVLLEQARFRRMARAPVAGDLVVQHVRARHVHLALHCGGSFIEAHAGLGRVIERPAGSGDKWHSVWRFPFQRGL